MSYNQFKAIFDEIRDKTPLPNGDEWYISILRNSGLLNNQGWTEVLYQNNAQLAVKL